MRASKEGIIRMYFKVKQIMNIKMTSIGHTYLPLRMDKHQINYGSELALLILDMLILVFIFSKMNDIVPHYGL